MKSIRGFTLIELLISISIIAILATLGFEMFQAVYRSSRDSRRQSDLKFIQSALEDYRADQLYYPASSSLTPGGSLIAGSKTYMTKVPNDPTANPDYSYVASPAGCNNTSVNCTSYCLFAQMETTTLTSDSVCTTLPAGFSTPKAYGVTKP